MITITVETDEEEQAVKDALRDGILHEVLGESFTIKAERHLQFTCNLSLNARSGDRAWNLDTRHWEWLLASMKGGQQ